MALTYILLEVELRVLLTSKDGKQGKPLLPAEINKEIHLSTLAKLARKEKFIDKRLYKEIVSFNDKRNDAIHGLVQGRIEYSQLESVCKETTDLIHKIQ